MLKSMKQIIDEAQTPYVKAKRIRDAAPELLEALQMARFELMGLNGPIEVLERIDAAIAKAEGTEK